MITESKELHEALSENGVVPLDVAACVVCAGGDDLILIDISQTGTNLLLWTAPARPGAGRRGARQFTAAAFGARPSNWPAGALFRPAVSSAR